MRTTSNDVLDRVSASLDALNAVITEIQASGTPEQIAVVTELLTRALEKMEGKHGQR